uniref:RRM domain-containing protein n=1 Tax=Moniliophthora roreri TaxID=221103 RepID=A0A0W0FC59_MONRR
MSERGRSASPKPIQDADIDMDLRDEKPDAKVIIVTNLTRNVVETHLRTIFGFYGQITKIDLPVFGKSGQNRGKAALEFEAPAMAHKAASHMNGGQLDGAVLKVELSDLPVRSRSRSPRTRNGRDGPRSHSHSISRSRSRSPPRYRGKGGENYRDSYRSGRGGGFGRRPGRGAGRGGRDFRRGGSRSRSRSPVRRGVGPRRRSPSYSRGGYGRMRRSRSRSRSYSVQSKQEQVV